MRISHSDYPMSIATPGVDPVTESAAESPGTAACDRAVTHVREGVTEVVQEEAIRQRFRVYFKQSLKTQRGVGNPGDISFIVTQEELRKMQTEQNQPIQVYCLDTRSDHSAAFLELAKSQFTQGYALTRVFYDQNEGRQDLRKTWMVFER